MHWSGGALNWSNKTNCTFGLDKTACIGMANWWEPEPQQQGQTKSATRPGIVISGVNIKMDKSAKWLGVIIDQELCFHTHTAYTLKKGTM
jgi:hypothetical protein